MGDNLNWFYAKKVARELKDAMVQWEHLGDDNFLTCVTKELACTHIKGQGKISLIVNP